MLELHLFNSRGSHYSTYLDTLVPSTWNIFSVVVPQERDIHEVLSGYHVMCRQ